MLNDLLASVGISVTIVIKLEVRGIVGRVERIGVDVIVNIDPVKACASPPWKPAFPQAISRTHRRAHSMLGRDICKWLQRNH